MTAPWDTAMGAVRSIDHALKAIRALQNLVSDPLYGEDVRRALEQVERMHPSVVALAKQGELEVERTLVLATAHVSVESAAILNAADKGEGESPAWAPHMSYDYGWIFYASESHDDVVDYPEEISAACKFAREHGCKWVRFDCDGPVIGALPSFDW